MEDEIKIEEDLVIGKLPEEEESEVVEEMDFVDFPTDYELVAAAFYALDAVDSLDPLYENAKRRKKRIMRKSLEILDYAINNLHTLCFDEKKDDDDNQEN